MNIIRAILAALMLAAPAWAFDATPLVQWVTAQSSAWTPASLSPVAWYKLDGNAVDSSTYANHGTLVNSPTNVVDRTGVLGGALGFGGTTRITIPNAAQLNLTTDLTLSCWVLSQSTAEGYVFCRNAFTAGTIQYAYLMGDVSQFCLNEAPRTSVTVPMSSWLHIVLVRSSGAVNHYTNGALAATATYTNALNSATNNNIGARSSAVDNSTSAVHFTGYVDDMLIFNRALTTNEITQLYNWRP